MNTHVFDQAIALTATGDGQYAGATSPAYANMVGPFGGITAATVLNAVLLHPALLGEPLSLTVNFCAALGDGAFSVSAQPVRTNRSTQHWVMAITQPNADGVADTVLTQMRVKPGPSGPGGRARGRAAALQSGAFCCSMY